MSWGIFNHPTSIFSDLGSSSATMSIQLLQIELYGCQIGHSRKTEILLTSTACGVMAAHLMNYQICKFVDMHGDAAISKQCQQKNLTFTANNTSCGAQPL